MIDKQHFAYELQVQTCLIDSENLLGFDQSWSLQLNCPWSEPIIAFPHPFGRPGRSGSQIQWQDRMLDLPPSGAFSTEFLNDPQPLTIQVSGHPQAAWSISTSYACDKVVVFANETAVSPEPYLVRCPPNGATLNWQVSYRMLSTSL